jgi:hypothetical protein
MGYYILYTKNTKLCLKIKHQVTQVQREVLELVYAKTKILTQGNAATDHYGRKESEIYIVNLNN